MAAALGLGALALRRTRAARRPALPRPAGADARLEPGSAVGEYRIVRPLGAGRMGQLYEAVDGSGSPTALRRVRDDFHRSERDLARFLAAARAVAAISHPNLAEIRSVFLERDRIFIATELVAGRALPRGRATLESARNVLSQASGALDCAHEAGSLHGDLKPSNLLLLPDGRLKVLDLGLAFLAQRLLAKETWSALAVGSPYAAPEQELGAAVAQSDVFSLGVVLYEQLVGRLPYEGGDLLARKRRGDFTPPSRAVAGLPPGLDALLSRALDPDPARRQPSPSELFLALVELEEEGP